jgi:hypothetical protein
MGKKACLSLDLGYDSWNDDYHDGDEDIDIAYEDLRLGNGFETELGSTRRANSTPVKSMLTVMNQCTIDATKMC